VIRVVMLNLGTTINTICICARSILGRMSISISKVYPRYQIFRHHNLICGV
jgi:hypothetical protein